MEDKTMISDRFFKWILALAGSTLLLTACASAGDMMQELEQKAVKSTRKSGERLAASPDDTAKAHSCESGKENVIFLELSEVLPERVNPGSEINHRLQVAFCPYAPSGTVKGAIVRRVLHKGRVTFTDSAQHEFKPGTWTIDAFITIPKNAPAGIYAMEVLVSYQDKSLKQTHNFVVKNR